ncbi:acyl-CoA dehydrogenase family protein [Streptomyces sp. MAR4 CNX-425]|uniref:acyl-CoA dehydrogenase family protein n=1 Tax=Streptomyces sp. MAR4 CNX-425 TaxID=3406343 RepID=UPI003B513953
MNLDLDAETTQMCEVVTAFARHKLAAPPDFGTRDFRQRWRAAGAQGVLGTTVPDGFGGLGGGAVTAAAVMEALGYGCSDAGFAFSAAAHVFACLTPIAEFGTEEQKRRWLPPLAAGELVAAHAVTEPDAGSDALRLSTRAVREDGDWVLSGAKCFITNAPVADVFVVQAVTAPGGGYFGLTSFLVEAGAPGLSVGPRHAKVGLRGSPTADVHLDGVRVPPGHVLGSEGGGASVFAYAMRWERTCLPAVYLGVMRRVWEQTREYARERRQFGVPIGDFQAVAHRVVDMLARLEQARLMLFRAARRLDAGQADEVAPALAKLVVSEAAVALGLDAVQVRGALGILDGEAETLLRDALPARVFSGTSDIQRNNIARALGLGARH